MNEEPRERDELLLKLNTLLEGKPAVLPGCEFFFSLDAPELWEQGADGPLVGLNRSSYLLVEFPATLVPREADAVFHELIVLGVTPIIAHPERNLVFNRERERLERLIGRGAMTQVTASSITGEFGRAALEAADELLRLGLVHVVASDSHSLDRRPPRMSAAREKVGRLYGDAVAQRLFVDTPKAIIDGQRLS